MALQATMVPSSQRDLQILITCDATALSTSFRAIRPTFDPTVKQGSGSRRITGAIWTAKTALRRKIEIVDMGLAISL